MGETGYYKGTSFDQDSRFADKQKKLMKMLKFGDCLNQKVDMLKVNADSIKPWITKRVTEMLTFEDDVLVDYILNQLEPRFPEPKQIQLNLTGFLNAKTSRQFLTELWELLLSAMENENGIPAVFIEARKQEIERKEKAEEEIKMRLKKEKEDIAKSLKEGRRGGRERDYERRYERERSHEYRRYGRESPVSSDFHRSEKAKQESPKRDASERDTTENANKVTSTVEIHMPADEGVSGVVDEGFSAVADEKSVPVAAEPEILVPQVEEQKEVASKQRSPKKQNFRQRQSSSEEDEVSTSRKPSPSHIAVRGNSPLTRDRNDARFSSRKSRSSSYRRFHRSTRKRSSNSLRHSNRAREYERERSPRRRQRSSSDRRRRSENVSLSPVYKRGRQSPTRSREREYYRYHKERDRGSERIRDRSIEDRRYYESRNLTERRYLSPLQKADWRDQKERHTKRRSLEDALNVHDDRYIRHDDKKALHGNRLDILQKSKSGKLDAERDKRCKKEKAVVDNVLSTSSSSESNSLDAEDISSRRQVKKISKTYSKVEQDKDKDITYEASTHSDYAKNMKKRKFPLQISKRNKTPSTSSEISERQGISMSNKRKIIGEDRKSQSVKEHIRRSKRETIEEKQVSDDYSNRKRKSSGDEGWEAAAKALGSEHEERELRERLMKRQRERQQEREKRLAREGEIRRITEAYGSKPMKSESVKKQKLKKRNSTNETDSSADYKDLSRKLNLPATKQTMKRSTSDSASSSSSASDSNTDSSSSSSEKSSDSSSLRLTKKGKMLKKDKSDFSNSKKEKNDEFDNVYVTERRRVMRKSAIKLKENQKEKQRLTKMLDWIELGNEPYTSENAEDKEQIYDKVAVPSTSHKSKSKKKSCK